MNKLLSFLLFSLFISNILCGEVAYGAACGGENTCKADVQECSTSTNKCVCAKGYKENTGKTDCDLITAGTYGGKCDSGACTSKTTQQCSSGYCVCATGLVEKKDGTDCEQPAAYNADCSNKNCADSTQTCDATTKKCVCASGYKENSAKNGCEKDTSGGSDGNSSSFLKTSLLILLGITF